MSTDSPGEFKGEVAGLKFGIVAARYNGEFVNVLLENVVENLVEAGVDYSDIAQIRVPGSNEVPYTISMMAETEDFDCLIALGVLIGGDTQHHIMVGSNTGKLGGLSELDAARIGVLHRRNNRFSTQGISRRASVGRREAPGVNIA